MADTQLSACQKSIGTTELLERILLELPCKYIALARKTHRFWYALIFESPKLQQRLFLAPEPETEYVNWIMRDYAWRSTLTRIKTASSKTLARVNPLFHLIRHEMTRISLRWTAPKQEPKTNAGHISSPVPRRSTDSISETGRTATATRLLWGL
jgi:hypothetical protein